MAGYDRMLVSSLFHKLFTPLFVFVTTQTTAPRANTLPGTALKLLGAPQGLSGAALGTDLGQPLHSWGQPLGQPLADPGDIRTFGTTIFSTARNFERLTCRRFSFSNVRNNKHLS